VSKALGLGVDDESFFLKLFDKLVFLLCALKGD